MNRHIGFALFFALAVPSAVLIRHEGLRAQSSQAPTAESAKVISAEDCTPARLGTDIPVAAIGEPVAGVTACRVQEAGSTTRKLMGRPFGLVSVGAIAPSIEQYAGAAPAAPPTGARQAVTPATGSPIAATGMSVPNRAGVQSSAEMTLAASAVGAWEGCALNPSSRIKTTDSAAKSEK